MILQFDDTFFTSIFFKLQEAKTRFIINYGGTGSSKSYSQAQNEIIKLLTTSTGDTVCFRKVARSHRESTLKELKEKIDIWELNKYFPVEIRWGGDAHEINFPEHKRKIVFLGMDDPDKIKSLKGFQRAWCEEMSEFSQEDFFEINRRLRAMDDIQITGSFNPISKNHWIKNFFFDNPEIAKETTIIKSTYKDNPYMSEIDRKHIEMLKDIDYNQWNIYANAEWGEVGVKRPWAYGFKDKNITSGLTFDYSLPVWLSFDFNIDPMTCLAIQVTDKWIKVIKEFRLLDSNIPEICEAIRNEFAFKNVYFKVTGDPSGNSRQVAMKDSLTCYRLIKNELKLSDSQFFVMKAHASLKDSRTLINYMLINYNVLINETCHHLIDDLTYCEVNDNGEIDKTKDKHRSHLLDCLKDFINYNYIKYLYENRLHMLKS